MSIIKNTKGLSDIISIGLMILMVTLSVGIIYSNFQDIIESPLLSPKLCKDTIKELSISTKISCYNPATNNLEITLTKTNENPLDSLGFKIYFNGEAKYLKCGSGCGNCEILEQETKTYFLFPDRIPKKITIIGNGCNIITQEIFPC